MKLVVNLKLTPLEIQHNALLETIKEANKACDWISAQAFQFKIFKQFDLHKLTYYQAKETFNLSAQVIIRAIAKVTDSYKLDKLRERTFKKYGAIAYDDRLISFKKNDLVSIWTTDGRLKIPFVMGDYQREIFQYRKGEVDLIYCQGQFFLSCVCDVPEDSPIIATDVIGVDFGIINIATTSDNKIFSGLDVERIRQKYFNNRQVLQHKASKQSNSGKRPRSIHKLLKRVSGRERNFRKIENHRISKTIVLNAKDTNRAIAIEELKGIRPRIEKRFRKANRSKVSGGSFYDLRQKIEYKAKLQGVQVIAVAAKYTSQTCSNCGHCEKANRKSQSKFECVQCHHKENADFNASQIIRSRASVNMLQSSENVGLKVQPDYRTKAHTITASV